MLLRAFIALLTRNRARKSDHQSAARKEEPRRGEQREGKAGLYSLDACRDARRQVLWSGSSMFARVPADGEQQLCGSQQARGRAESSSGPEDRLPHHRLPLSHLRLDQYYFPLEATNGPSSQHAQQAPGWLASSIGELAERSNWL